MKRRVGKALWLAAWLSVPAPALAQQVTATVGRPPLAALPRGQIAVDIVTATRHPAYLEPMALKTPEGVRIVASEASPDNARLCPRGATSGSECRQLVRVFLDTLPRCHAGGDYEALFRINCWPGTAASLCKPGAYPYNFRLEAEPACAPPAGK